MSNRALPNAIVIKCDCRREIRVQLPQDGGYIQPFPCPDCGSLLDPATWPDVKAYLEWMKEKDLKEEVVSVIQYECADTFSLHVRTRCRCPHCHQLI